MSPRAQKVKYKRLAERFAKLQKANKSLQAENAALRDRILQVEVESAALRDENLQLREESAARRDSDLQRQAEIDALRDRNLQMEAESAAQSDSDLQRQAELAENQDEILRLTDEKRRLTDEIRRLKKLPKRPVIKPSRMHETATEKADRKGDKKKRSENRRGAKRYSPRAAEREDAVKCPNVPEGSVRNGYVLYEMQNLIVVPEVVRYKRERWTTPDGKSLTAPLPPGVEGHYSAAVRRIAVMLYCKGQSTFERVTEMLNEFGITIAKRTVIRMISEQSEVLAEADEVLEAGLRGAVWVNVDDTGARHQGKNGYCTVVGNDLFTRFSTSRKKNRVNFLRVLGGCDERLLLSPTAFDCMRQRRLPAAAMALLADHAGAEFADLEEWLQFLETIGVAALKVTPDPVKIATEAACWGALVEYRGISGTVLLSDDAGQFRIGLHALCWVHAERLVHKLSCADDAQHQAQADKQSQIWEFYGRLLAYRESPDMEQRARLSEEFDRIFKDQKTGHVQLDALLGRLHGKKDELLTVLEHPATPLHTNGAERDIRCQVTRRKISSGTRSEQGRDSRDAWLSLMKTCLKLNIPFWDFLGSRFKVPDAPDVPRLATLVAQKTGPP
jgi:hypothetical protein